MILANGYVGIRVLMELCQRIQDEKGMPAEWPTTVVIPISKGNGDIMNCGMYRDVKLLEDAMKKVEKVLEKNYNDRYMLGKGKIDIIFILRRIQEEYLDKQKKLHMCIVDMGKAFYRLPMKVVEWTRKEFQKHLLEQ